MEIQANPVSRAYAEALFRSARDRGLVPEVDESLQGLAAVLRDNPQFSDFLQAPMIDTATKKSTLEKALSGRVEDLVVDFLCLLIDKDREESFAGIVQQYRVLADREARRLRVDVRTSHPLSDTQREQLQGTLQQVLRHDCMLEAKVEPELIGGMVLRIGDKLYDGSVRRQLQRLGDQFMRSSGYED
jgi:F-type H+-transporting ATPase subunit delta